MIYFHFIKEKDYDFHKDPKDEEFIERLAYQSDIFQPFKFVVSRKNCIVIYFISNFETFVQKLKL